MIQDRCFIIAEAGVNHDGNEDRALELVNAAIDAGADAVKFQTFSAAALVRPGTGTADYQRQNSGETDQLEMLRRLELPARVYERVIARCAERGIEFMSTPFDAEAAAFLLRLGMRRIKVPSGEITNLPFLRFLGRQARPIIVSTGMASLSEVADAIDSVANGFREAGVSTPIGEMLSILHCTSNYPTVASDVNLRAMQTMERRFGLPVGLSDHTMGTSAAIAAVALGARIIEKHLTLNRNLPGPDHRASLEPGEFKSMVEQIRFAEDSLGDGTKAPRASELAVRDLVRRSLCARNSISAGAIVGADDVVAVRPGTGIAPSCMDRVVGRRAARNIAAGAMLSWNDITQ